MRALVLAVVLMSGLEGRAGAQTQTQTPVPLPRDGSSSAGAVYNRLASPCYGVVAALVDEGLNPAAPTYGIQQLLRRGYAVMLPVLVEVALNPALAAEPHGIRERMAEQTRGARLYAARQIPPARQALTEALAADPPSEGAMWVAAILADPDTGPPWRATLANNGLPTDRSEATSRDGRAVW